MKEFLNLLALVTGYFVWSLVIAYFLFETRIIFRRPWYCIKHLMPWKTWTIKRWQETEQSLNKERFASPEDEWYSRFKMKLINKNFGIMKDCGHHLWWEPTYRFFWIRG